MNGDVGCTGSGAVGALVGTNSGTIFACHHTGLVKGTGVVAGLVGTNTGSILFSYHAGELDGTTKYGVAPSGSITDCYYDNKLAAVTTVTGVTGKTTGEMQKRSFVDDVYTAAEAESENRKAEHLKEDSNGKKPDEDGYERTYKDGYTPIAEGDPKPSSTSNTSLNGQIYNWLTTGAGNANANKAHFQTHSYLYQPAAYPKMQ